MPFTPFHMGPGIAVKALLQGSFSLMVFGWAQIVMDIQPLLVMISGEGHVHGFSHTYVGATLLSIFSALSAFIGTYSHVLLDSTMHVDVEPLFPFTTDNLLLGLVSVNSLHMFCLYSALVGGTLYFAINWFQKR